MALSSAFIVMCFGNPGFNDQIKRMDMEGIADNPKDSDDAIVHEVFSNVATEIIHRLNKIKA